MKPFYNASNKYYTAIFFVFSVFEILFCGGVTFGWASITIVFKMEHFYLDFCHSFYEKNNMTFPTEGLHRVLGNRSFEKIRLITDLSREKLPGCPVQDKMFNLIFTISVFCFAGSKFPAGMFIDRFGARKAMILGGCFYIAAAFGLGFVRIGYEDFLFPVFISFCLGGSFLVISIFQICTAIYPNTKSQVICFLNGIFDSSAVVLLLFLILYDLGFDYKSISLGYAIICTSLTLIGTATLTPPKSLLFKWMDVDSTSSTSSVQDSNARSYLRRGSISNHSDTFNSAGYLHSREDAPRRSIASSTSSLDVENTSLITNQEERFSVFSKGSVWQTACSSLYLMEVVYLSIFQLRLWYYVGALPDYIGRLSSNDKATVSFYITLFGYIQLCGILVTPFIGIIFDRDRYFKSSFSSAGHLNMEQKKLMKLKQCILPFIITNILCVALSILNLIQDMRVQIPSFILFTTVRGFIYADHASFVATAFPAKQFGTLYGLALLTAATIGLFEYVLFTFTAGPLHGNHFYTNVILLCLVIISNVHPINLWWYCRKENERLKACYSEILHESE